MLRQNFEKLPKTLRNLIKTIVFNCLAWSSRLTWVVIARQPSIKLDIGCRREEKREGFLSVDRIGADLCHDLLKKFPVRDNSVDEIYASHVFEHFTIHDALNLMRECHRILKPRGRLRIVCPNFDYYLAAYCDSQKYRTKHGKEYWADGYLDTGSKLDELNYVAHMGGEHRLIFNPELGKNLTLMAGFSIQQEVSFDPSKDIAERSYESCYVEATK